MSHVLFSFTTSLPFATASPDFMMSSRVSVQAGRKLHDLPPTLSASQQRGSYLPLSTTCAEYRVGLSRSLLPHEDRVGPSRCRTICAADGPGSPRGWAVGKLLDHLR